MHQIDNFGEHLEGMVIGTSRAEDLFKKCASIAVVVLFVFMLAHQVMKFLRFKQTDWQPNVSSTFDFNLSDAISDEPL